MGAGGFYAGAGLAGHDPIASPITDRTALNAHPKFDPSTKTYPYASDGSVEEVDPIWQQVAHRLGIPLGALSFARDVGFDVERARTTTREHAQRTVEDAVRNALLPMIEQGDVVIDSVRVAQPWSGKWEVRIRNLRDPGSDPRLFGSH